MLQSKPYSRFLKDKIRYSSLYNYKRSKNNYLRGMAKITNVM